MQYCSQCARTYPADYRVCPRHNTPLEGKEELEAGMIVREKYKILELIGDGAMGRVWLIEDLDFTYKKVRKAMKVPLPHLATDPAYVQRFRDEAAKAGVLDHPNVVRTEHIDRTESGTPFLLMELVDGRSLRWWVEREPRLQWRHSVEIAREIALALEAAHAAGLVHCDIKPENVLAVSKAAPYPLKVTDFGLAKATSALTGDLTRVHPGTTWGNDVVAGTPGYIAPEQALSRGTVVPASDVYSLGVMLYEMLTGDKPYGQLDSVEAVRLAHQGPPALLRARSEWPAGLAELTNQMLALDPAGRPPAGDVAARLGAMLQGAGLLDPQVTTVATAPAAAVPSVATAAPAATGAATAPGAPSGFPVRSEVPPVVAAPPAAAAQAKSRQGLFVAVGAAALGVVVLVGGLLFSSHQAQPLPADASVTPGHGATPPAVSEPREFKPLIPADPQPAAAPPAETGSAHVPTPAPPAEPGRQADKRPSPTPARPAERSKQTDKRPSPPAASQDADALDRLGTKQLADHDWKGARESLTQAASLRNPHSMVMLGAMYSEERNYPEAARMFRQAADLGSARGMYNLGVLYETGKGVPQSLEDAARWYGSAERLGEKDARYRLGTMYERGAGGMAKDLQKARDLYQRAGTPEASKRLATMTAGGSR